MIDSVHRWKRISSGKYVDIANLTIDDLDIEDINTSLNYIYRFNGHHKETEPLTVAQHSYLCYVLSVRTEPTNYRLQLACLTHDFAESIIGDIVVPVKYTIGSGYSNFAMPIERIFEKKFFGGLVSQELHDKVKLYDLASLDIERRVMWGSQYGLDKWPKLQLDFGTLEDKNKLFHSVSEGKIDLRAIWKFLYQKVNV